MLGRGGFVARSFEQRTSPREYASFFFEWITDASELREQWASWCDWGRDEWRYAGEDEKPVRCMIYPLDRDHWAAWRVCDITGGLSATPSDESVTGREASARLRDLVIHAQWHNGELRPVSDPEASAQ